MSGELRALTSVRGVAAWLVVLYHIRRSIAGLPDAAVAALGKGYLAVDFFFLLSGFVIWLAWHERFRAAGLVAMPGFLWRRVARIWPLHLFMLACAAGLAALLAVTGRDTSAFPIGELPFHVLLIQNWGLTSDLNWNDPAWSISAELAAYLAFPLLTLAIDWRRVPSWAIVAAVAALAAILHATFAARDATTLGSDIARLGLVRCVLEFSAGTAICALWLRWRAAPAWPAAGAVLAAVALLASGLPETLRIPLAFAAALLALALTSGAKRNPLDRRALHYLGEISYATYLSHFILWIAFKLVFVSDARAVPPASIALYLALVLAASVALYHLVERPAQRWLNALAPRGRRAVA